ncbi:MAG: M48 family metalloprotease [Thiobacillus sp.]|nr:M48 family metalloprotease [Thiobacillus sp.]
MMRIRIVGLLLVLALPAGAGGLVPWTHAVTADELDSRERSLWQEADEFDRALARAGRVNSDPVLTAYLQGIMDRLYPEFSGRLKVRLLNAQHLNAFALPNGSVYVNAGLVARFRNEAQLATVLAHEGAHFTHRHSLQQAERVRNAAAFARVAGMLGVPLVGDLLALSSMFGFSREHEREADQTGYQRLVAAGYAPRESVKTFEHLQAEIRAAGIKEPFFFSSHPKLQERIDNFTELSQNAASGETGYERFVETTAALRLASLERDLAAYRYKQVILMLTTPQARREYPPEAAYYLGEAYRLRNDAGDAERAEAEFRRALDTAPRFAPTHRALGYLYFKRGDRAAAAPLLRRYLELAPEAADRDHIAATLKEISTP